MGTTALVFGIISLINVVSGGFELLVSIIGLPSGPKFWAYTFIAFVTAIVAIILGAIAKKDPNQKGAKSGLILGIIALSCGIIGIVASFVFVFSSM